MGTLKAVRVFLALLFLGSMTIASFPKNMPRLCYTGKEVLGESYLMPCFNTLNETDKYREYACCIVGDYCLANSSCWNTQRHFYYQKGCTAKFYDDPVCPNKCNSNQTKSDYVGLIYCNGTNGMPNNTWACNHPDNCASPSSNCPVDGSGHWDPQLEVTKKTWCENIKHDGQWKAFSAPSPIRSIYSLPWTDGVVKWYSDHSEFGHRWNQTYSTSNPDPYATSTPLSTPVEFTAIPTQSDLSGNTSIGPPLETSSSKGQKTGLAVGLGLGVPILLAGVGFLIYYLRKRHNDSVAREESGSPSGVDQRDGTTGEDKAGDSKKEAYGYSTKAELPAEEIPVQVPEMEGSSVGKPTPMQSPTDPLLSGHSGTEDLREHQTSSTDNPPVFELAG